MDIYTFDKSLKERLTELTEILSSRGVPIPASQIKCEWSSHIELTIEPVGWQALWKIPRSLCQDFEIHYPTIVLVQVEHIYFTELSALVKITGVQDEIHLPEKYDVSLIEIYPTKDQENTALDIEGTANCIDQLRFFFSYLWMPWDLDDDEDVDWVSAHLESRIRLFFDMKRGAIAKDTCDVIRTLIREGQEIQEKISKLESLISDEEEMTETMDEEKTYELMKLHFRLQQIKAEIEVLENPTMREVLSKSQNSNSTNDELKICENQHQIVGNFVWLGGSLEKMQEAINVIRNSFSSHLFLKTSASLQEALTTSKVGDIVILGDGEHWIRGAGKLEHGGKIKGIYDPENTIILPNETKSGPSLLDFSGDKVFLENISIDLGELQVGIIVRNGSVGLKNCHIYASHRTIIKLGIVVMPGAKLFLEDITFKGLGTAIVIYATGEVKMNNCYFKECAEGVQLHDNGFLNAQNTGFMNFKEYAIRMETEKHLETTEGSKSGSVELLNDVKEIILENCEFKNNEKGDVSIKRKLIASFNVK